MVLYYESDLFKTKKYITKHFCLQADINGLKWCKYTGKPCSLDSPLEDPVLVSFSTALENNILCSWRHAPPLVSQKLNHGLSCSESPKELWLFWYGDDPRKINIVDKHLKGTVTGAYTVEPEFYDHPCYQAKVVVNDR